MRLLNENGDQVHMNDLVAVEDETTLMDHFVVTVLFGETKVGTKEFSLFPTDEQLIWCIQHFQGDGCTIQRKYVLGRVKQ